MEDPGEFDRMKLGQLRGWISANGGKVAGLLEKGEFIAVLCKHLTGGR